MTSRIVLTEALAWSSDRVDSGMLDVRRTTKMTQVFTYYYTAAVSVVRVVMIRRRNTHTQDTQNYRFYQQILGGWLLARRTRSLTCVDNSASTDR